MRLFEIKPQDVPDKKFTVWHLDLDHVVSMRDGRDEDGKTYWWVEQSNNQNFVVTKACFDRMMLAWESK